MALPANTSLVTIGFKQTYVALRECMRLKQTFLFLIFYFLMCVYWHRPLTVSHDNVKGRRIEHDSVSVLQTVEGRSWVLKRSQHGDWDITE